MNKIFARIAICSALLWPCFAMATLVEPELFDFKLTPKYNDAHYWALRDGTHPTEPLIDTTPQLQQFRRFKTKWFSPWTESAITRAVKNDRYANQLNQLSKRFRGDVTYAISCSKTSSCNAPLMQSNFRPFPQEWFANIENNTQLKQFENLTYNPKNRAIMVHNSLVRVFPVLDAYYEREKNIGLFHPFDRLQMSNIWAGTPVYILGTTKDKAWHYIYTHSFSGWVQTQNVARADDAFIQQWQNADPELIAIMRNNVSLNNTKNDEFITQIGIGAVLPGEQQGNNISVSVPLKSQDGLATIAKAKLKNGKQPLALSMPVTANRQNFANLLSEMVNKPYGWGGTAFNHDCSQELKNLYAPFGIWLARNSRSQLDSVKLIKLDEERSLKKRLAYLRKNAKPFMTLVYVGGHIMLYVGEDDKNMPVFYQNVWYVWKKDEPGVQIIGQSLFLPADVKASNTYSLIDATASDYFWLAHLDQPT